MKTPGRASCDACGAWKGVRDRDQLDLSPDAAGWLERLCTACAHRLRRRGWEKAA